MEILTPPPDKAISHRAVIIAALSRGKSRLRNISLCEDVLRTVSCLKKMNAGLEISGNEITVRERRLEKSGLDLYCGGSASTMRFLTGVLCGLGAENSVLRGDSSLNGRPMDALCLPLAGAGADIGLKDGIYPPLEIRGVSLKTSEFRQDLPSAQVKTALLLAGGLSFGKCLFREKIRTRNHTENLLKFFGAEVKTERGEVSVENFNLRGADLEIPGDFSSAAPFIAAAVLMKGARVEIRNVSLNPGRTGFLKALERMGARVSWEIRGGTDCEPFGDISAEYSPRLKAVEVPGEEVPSMIDEIPLLALVMSHGSGVSVVRSASLLRSKESDRLAATGDILGKCGVAVSCSGGILRVKGGMDLRGNFAHDGFGDHRMIMMLAVIGAVSGGRVEIHGKERVSKSYPSFFRDFRKWLSGSRR